MPQNFWSKALLKLAVFWLWVLPITLVGATGNKSISASSSVEKIGLPPLSNKQLDFESLRSKVIPVNYSSRFKRSFTTLTAMEGIITSPYAPEIILEVSDKQEEQRQKALQLEEEVKAAGKFLESLDPHLTVELPVGIKKSIGGLDYIIIINKAVLQPGGGTRLEAYMSFEIPQNDQKISFLGKDILFTKEGGLEHASLFLIGSYSLKIGNTTIVLRGDSTSQGKRQTFVEWDCHGFKQMNIVADLFLSKDLFLPDKDGVPDESRPVTASFDVTIQSWDDLLVGLSLEPFQVKGLKGVTFEVKNAVIDMSDLRNPLGSVFPKEYRNNSDPTELWRGIFIREVSIKLPKQFKDNESQSNPSNKKRFEIQGTNMIIDNRGFTGAVAANNIISLEKGRMGNWAFSLDRFSLGFEANQITSAGFGGTILVPILDKGDTLRFSAIVDPGDAYIFVVSPPKKVKIPLFNAGEVVLTPASSLTIAVIDDKFLPSANLHGTLSVKSGGVALANIGFENLRVQSVEPYVTVGAMSLGSPALEQKMGNFPIQIKNIGFQNLGDGDLALKFEVSVRLMKGNDSGGIGGDAGFLIVGKRAESGGLLGYKYDHLQISKVGIAADMGAIKLVGSLEWFKGDEIYGKGFKGQAMLDVTQFSLEASVLFGNIDGMRYWYADAMVRLKPGIGSVLLVTGLGGGAFYHMSQASSGGSELGRGLSGVIYVPDENIFLGFKATVELATIGSDKIFNGDVTFEIAFNSGGGVRYIDFRGNGYFLTTLQDAGKAGLIAKAAMMTKGNSKGNSGGTAGESIYGVLKPAPIAARVQIHYDFPNKTLHGNFEVFINVAGGVIKGIGPNNRAGWSVMHFSPSEWYIYVGTPDDPIGVELLGMARSESYFMVGQHIPASPPPPDKVSEILGGIDLDYMSDLNALGEGRGMAFGTRFSMDTGELKFFPFYSRFEAGLGFDLMLKDYGNNVRCSGRDGTLGIDGWYANGQAFGYFEGKIGILVKLLKKTKKYEILNIGAAAILQAQLPNPSWLYGAVGGKFSVLGGMVKGDCRFEITLGDKCQIVGNSVLENIDVIADVTPGDGESGVNIFNAPQAIFNLAVDREFALVDEYDATRYFRITLDYAKVLDGSTEVDGELEWNKAHDVLAFNAHEILPPEKPLTFKVSVYYQEKINNNWTTVKEDGAPLSETREINFTTGEAPDYIPDNNVLYSYPLDKQYNFYSGESSSGYVQLKQGQSYLFRPSSEWFQKIRLKQSGNSNSQLKDFRYDSALMRLTFNVPSLNKEKIYKFEIVNLPAVTQALDENVSLVESRIGSNKEVSIGTKDAEGSLNILEEKILFDVIFRTSKYNTFSDKVKAISFSGNWDLPSLAYQGVHDFGNYVSNPIELFDDHEINGGENFDPLIVFEASPNNQWLTNIIPWLYKNYPLNSSLKFTWRSTEIYGVVPLRSVIYSGQNKSVFIGESSLVTGTGGYSFSGENITYRVPYFVYNDLSDLQNQINNFSINHSLTSAMITIRDHSWPLLMRSIPYEYEIKYRLPGQAIFKTTLNRSIQLSSN